MADAVVNVLIIGESGCGKSTFINTVCNFLKQGSLENPCVAIPTKYLDANQKWRNHSENDRRNQKVSQTNQCSMYDFKMKDGRTLNLIDTPGMSDTRGVKQDELNISAILQYVGNLPSLHCIIVLVNGRLPRLSSQMLYSVCQLSSSLPDALKDNILVVLTNSTKVKSTFDVSSLEYIEPAQIFHLDNSAFAQDPSSYLDDEEAYEDIATDWRRSMKTIDKMLRAINAMSPASTKAFEEMKLSRDAIQAALHAARQKIVNLQKVQDELEAAKKVFEECGQDAEKFKDYIRKKEVRKKELVDASYHSTICSTCSHVCHDHCGLEELGRGDQKFTQCAAFNGKQNCNACPQKCGPSVHYHDTKTMRETVNTLEEVMQDMKQKYDQAAQGKQKAGKKLTDVQQAQAAVQKEVEALKAQISSECRRLKSLCSGFNFVRELHTMIKQLQLESESLRSLTAKQSADSFLRALIAICEELSKDPDLNSARRPPHTTHGEAHGPQPSGRRRSKGEYQAGSPHSDDGNAEGRPQRPSGSTRTENGNARKPNGSQDQSTRSRVKPEERVDLPAKAKGAARFFRKPRDVEDEHDEGVDEELPVKKTPTRKYRPEDCDEEELPVKGKTSTRKYKPEEVDEGDDLPVKAPTRKSTTGWAGFQHSRKFETDRNSDKDEDAEIPKGFRRHSSHNTGGKPYTGPRALKD